MKNTFDSLLTAIEMKWPDFNYRSNHPFDKDLLLRKNPNYGLEVNLTRSNIQIRCNFLFCNESDFKSHPNKFSFIADIVIQENINGELEFFNTKDSFKENEHIAYSPELLIAHLETAFTNYISN